MDKRDKIYVAGHQGLVGSAIYSNLLSKGYQNLVGKSKQELDLMDRQAVARFFENEKPKYVFLAAAKVGGIMANNTYRAEFIYENLTIQNNVIHEAWRSGVKKLLFLGSTCIYPRDCPQPMKEEYLLTAPLEYTNEPYAIAKIAGIKMCESYNLQYGTNFISVMPTNLYGPNDNFDLEKSHVLPAMIRKILLAKYLEESDFSAIRSDLDRRPVGGITGAYTNQEIIDILAKYGIKLINENKSPNSKFKIKNSEFNPVQLDLWGTGKPMREFLWSEEMADACVFIMERIDFRALISEDSRSIRDNSHEIRNTHINIGTGQEISIHDLAHLIKKVIGFRGQIQFDPTKPDGALRKLTDVSKLHALGWQHKIGVEEGVKKLVTWYREN